jgi:L-alanine-DL-glutamate epimerase-like enolase superfamily enzyme
MKGGRIIGRSPEYARVLRSYPFLDGPMFDLIGKINGRAAWRLIGESARERVEPYDGTLYFSDIWFRDRGTRAVVEEAEEAVKSGYRGLKLKVGRGWKWMEPEAGLRRDVEVVHAVRKAVGEGVRIMVDANNGYQNEPERAWRLLAETAADDVYWLEEPFPEEVGRYTELRAKVRGRSKTCCPSSSPGCLWMFSRWISGPVACWRTSPSRAAPDHCVRFAFRITGVRNSGP